MHTDERSVCFVISRFTSSHGTLPELSNLRRCDTPSHKDERLSRQRKSSTLYLFVERSGEGEAEENEERRKGTF